MSLDVIENMRGRAAYCRLIADGISDARTAKILRDMADEIEADVQRLEVEAGSKAPREGQPADLVLNSRGGNRDH